jgi:hypothetical protein
MELLPESETKYFIMVQDVTFTFGKDESGKVTEMIVQPVTAEAIKAKRLN